MLLRTVRCLLDGLNKQCPRGASERLSMHSILPLTSVVSQTQVTSPNYCSCALKPNSTRFHLLLNQKSFHRLNSSRAYSKPVIAFTEELLVMESAEKVDAIGSRLPAEAMRILQSLASHWDDVIDVDGLQVIRLKGAMTNEVYQIKWPTNRERSRKVLVRIYGEGVDVFFDRELEIRTFEFMSKQGQGPRLLGRFSNGRIEEFIRARTLSACDLRDPDISALIASKLKEFHDLDMPGPKKALVWDRLRKWIGTAKSMCSAEESEALRLDAIEKEIETLYKCLASDQHIVFCHNDLQYGNIMMDEDTRSITIIDYEYACYNPFMFDIANHFCEMAADYHTETPHVLDYSKYPDLEERRRFLHVYLSSSGNPPVNSEVDKILEEVEKYTLASHLMWGLWGVISEHVNEIDFDYMEYAKQRFQEYWLQKPKVLGCTNETVD